MFEPEKPRATAAPVVKVDPVGLGAVLDPELDCDTEEEEEGVLLETEEGELEVAEDELQQTYEPYVKRKK